MVVKMSFEFTAKDNFPDYTGYKCMVSRHLTLDVRTPPIPSRHPSVTSHSFFTLYCHMGVNRMVLGSVGR